MQSSRLCHFQLIPTEALEQKKSKHDATQYLLKGRHPANVHTSTDKF